MKQSMNLAELARELRCQSLQKKDYVVDTRSLNFESKQLPVINPSIPAKTISRLTFMPTENAMKPQEYVVTENTHRQMASRLDIPWKYYETMLSHSPELLDRNVNHWLHAHPERRMIRTMDRSARAFLSDRYRRLDNYDLAESVLPVLAQMRNAEVISCDLSPEKMYIKVIHKELSLEVAAGDVVQAGIVISNSEVGLGSLRVEPLVYRLVCTNGLIARDFSQKRYHVGKTLANDSDAYELYSDATIAADDKAFFLKVQDTVRASIDKAKFELIVNRLRDTRDGRIECSPIQSVEALASRLLISADEQDSVLRHLIEGRDLSAYGLINAVTHASQTLNNYERATTFERFGGQMLAMPKTDWRDILYGKAA
ncbi:MAG: DUF932 domain-containing protein [Negativicutes bacterium]|jgi:hypothetical protein